MAMPAIGGDLLELLDESFTKAEREDKLEELKLRFEPLFVPPENLVQLALLQFLILISKDMSEAVVSLKAIAQQQGRPLPQVEPELDPFTEA